MEYLLDGHAVQLTHSEQRIIDDIITLGWVSAPSEQEDGRHVFDLSLGVDQQLIKPIDFSSLPTQSKLKYFVPVELLSLQSFRPSARGYFAPTTSLQNCLVSYEAHLASVSPELSSLYPSPSILFVQDSRSSDRDLNIPSLPYSTSFLTSSLISTIAKGLSQHIAIVYKVTGAPDLTFASQLNQLDVQITDTNNEYYTLHPTTSCLGIDNTRLYLIYPANPRFVWKYRESRAILIEETPELYKAITEPKFISISTAPKALDWVYDVLEGRSEADTAIVLDNHPLHGFILAKDTKWPMKLYHETMKFAQDRKGVDNNAMLPHEQLVNMYFLAIINAHGVKTIRDLCGDHLPLLINMKNRIELYLWETFGIPKHLILMYFHYHPTFYHLHLHVESTATEKTSTGRCISLTEVISNLTIDSLYYTKVTLPCLMNEFQAKPYLEYRSNIDAAQ